jgi:alpha-aminoadipic semialdehyde synthase
VNGSIEFLERTCTIEKPFFQYDPIQQREVASDIGPVGVTVMGTDILPSELPRESSEHFGQAVLGVVRELVQARKMSLVGEDGHQQHGVDVRLLSPGIANACITSADGELEAGYRYLGPLMRRAAAEKNQVVVAADHDCSMQLSLVGHLFDSGTCLVVVVLPVDEEGHAP